ncbi:MAG: nucleotidyltransferase domain-containing protein [Oscillospiraceae bacterium]|nr:nucleotidyltransferase domain-containing protein [Oscillospiraceae bacterium]
MLSGKAIQAILRAEHYPYITRVGVFGSHARSEETSASDIDILIDYDNSSDGFLDDLDGYMEDIEQLFHGEIDYITMPGLMKSSNEAFRSEILRDIVWVYNANGAVIA